jgi:hypothetical protein
MKREKIVVGIVLGLTFLTSVSAPAGQEREGGDILVLARERAAQTADLVFDLKLKTQVARYFEWIKKVYFDIEDSHIRQIFYPLIQIGSTVPGVEDVWNSEYFVSMRPCLDTAGRRQAAVTQVGDLGGRICLDSELLQQQKPSNKELLGLLVHEHAHHFGYSHQEQDSEVPDPLIKWVVDRADGFFAAIYLMSDVGCMNSYFSNLRGVQSMAGALIGYTVGGFAIPMLASNHNDERLAGLGTLAISFWLWNIFYNQPHQTEKRYRHTYELMTEAAKPDPSPDHTRLGKLYDRVIHRSNDPNLKDRLTFLQFRTVIMNGDTRSAYCPVLANPMTEDQIADWARTWIREHAPLEK